MKTAQVAPLDFTVAAEKVMPAVVYIRSTQEGRNSKKKCSGSIHSAISSDRADHKDLAKAQARV